MPSSSKTLNSGRQTLSYGTLSLLLGDPTRWRILEVLAEGEPITVKDIARRVGKEPTLVQKFLASMRRSGVVVLAPGRINMLAPAFRPQPGTKDIDFGRCILRFGGA